MFASPYWTSARSISCFLSLPHSEIQTDSLIRHALRDGKRIYVPFCPVEDKTVMRMVRLTDLDHFERLEANRWGIREVDPKEVRVSLDWSKRGGWTCALTLSFEGSQVESLEDGPSAAHLGVENKLATAYCLCSLILTRPQSTAPPLGPKLPVQIPTQKAASTS